MDLSANLVMIDAEFMRQPPRPQKSTMACDFCRAKKIKCNGGQPCPNCEDHRLRCHYTPVRPRRQQQRTNELRNLQHRLNRIESLLPDGNPTVQQTTTGANETSANTVSISTDPMANLANETAIFPSAIMNDVLKQGPNTQANLSLPMVDTNETTTGPETQAVSAVTHRSSLPNILQSSFGPVRISSAGPPPAINMDQMTSESRCFTLDSELTPPQTIITPGSEDDDGSFTYPPEEEANFEYHGPGSFLSICSKSGVEWVVDKTGAHQFRDMSRDLTESISRRLKLDMPLPSTREPEPLESTAWMFVNDYYELDPDAAFSTVNRQTFEGKLRTFFEKRKSGDASLDNDAGWYALRNAIYAAGCRMQAVRTPGSCPKVLLTRSWNYFLNALSRQSELMFCRTSLQAVQALSVMMFFVEGVGCPSIDYTLCLDAMKLAQSKGLHRQPAAAWNLGTSVTTSRSNLWWAIYFFERQNALRAGRPLAIDDSDVTCQMPSDMVPDGSTNITQIRTSLTHAKLSSEISKTITSLKASTPTLVHLSNTISELDAKLQTWWDSVPAFIRDCKYNLPGIAASLPSGMKLEHVIYQHYAYYGSVLAIHSIFVQPWHKVLAPSDPAERARFDELVASSTAARIKATRNFVNMLPQLEMNLASPKWLVFQYPITALINLFIHIIQAPLSETTDSDISLMHLVSGHFNNLEFISPEMNFPFVRQLAGVALRAVSLAKAQAASVRGQSALPDFRPTMSLDAISPPIQQDLVDMDCDYEEWGTLVGWLEPDGFDPNKGTLC